MKKSTKPSKFDFPSFVFNIVVQSVIIVLIICIPLFFLGDPSRFEIKYFWPFILLSFMSIVAYLVCRVQTGRDNLTKLQNQYNFTVSLMPLYIGKKLPLYTGLFLNLKSFKFLNRKLGHEAADEVLQKYAREIKHFLVRGEHASRLGGDNFLIIVYKHRIQDFLKLLENIEIPVNVDEEETLVRVETRAGIYAFNESTNIGDVYNYTSIALNYAKNQNVENFVWFKPFMAEEIYKDKEMSFQFQEAIKNHNFEVYYQPIVNAGSNIMTGAEALVRWNRNGQIILPEEFVPRLENNGLIKLLDFYVLEKVCSDIKEWQSKGIKPVLISTNFSKKDLQMSDFAVKIIETINKSGIDKSLIQIELTESADKENEKMFSDFFELMSANKIGVTVDDFGVGFSSLELLKNRHVNTIKLNKSFVENIEQNTGDNTDAFLVKNIIRTCYDLKKTVICEGVENSEQRQLLENMRSFLIQGYLYDKPLKKEEFEYRLINPKYEEN